jgi:ATP-dependent Clp protease ATP-binding subunit ClpA
VFERFTDRARRVVVFAQEESRLLNHQHIGTEHILLGLIQEGEGVAARVLAQLGISLEKARQGVEATILRGEKPPRGHIPFTPRAKKVLELSLREAVQLGHNYIGTEHILLGLVREGDGVAAQVLVGLGADLGSVREEVVEVLEGRAAVEISGGGEDWVFAQEPAAPRSGAKGELGQAIAGTFKIPVCPACKASLDRTAGVTTLDVPDPSGASHPVRFVFCTACGESLLASDA